MDELITLGQKAKEAAFKLANIGSLAKNNALESMRTELLAYKSAILEANKMDMEAGKKAGLNNALLDRLMLDNNRIEAMAASLAHLAGLADPIGEVLSMHKRPNGLLIGQVRVPLGVVCIIYEARPGVTVDAAALCIKTGNAVILKGGREAIESNKAISIAIKTALQKVNFPESAVQLITDTSREYSLKLMKMHDYIDVLIPRGGKGLIDSVIQNSLIPVIETGSGNCHIYVNSEADFEMAKKIVINAKTSRPGVCNATEKLLVDESIADSFLPAMLESLYAMGVEIRGDSRVCALFDKAKIADDQDWYEEYLDYIIAVKSVKNIDEAVYHINKYGSKHSEAIITDSYSNAQKFLGEVDAAAVFVNASTRFTDGYEFGFGAELGISTQKLHVRGPMGLEALSSLKYIIYGDGQTR